MFSKLLIANRGEIACRVIKTARALGIHTIAVYSDADREARHVRMADEAVHIGGSAPAESYLDMEKVLTAARDTGAQAVHPGYGFLSENAAFSQRCAEFDVQFIGPPVKAIEIMGSKSAAKQAMEAAGVPILPGYHGDQANSDQLQQAAESMGFPVLLKAVAGGGGKGMRRVDEVGEFANALATAKREAQSSFGNDAMLVEKFLQNPRHVEVQVFCDALGNGVYLFERDCSIQRRHQKIIEEAPAPRLTEELRTQMGEAALRAAIAVDYVGAGTVEFLLSDEGEFFFMEMNTRLQVEHPVTEMITGVDLVAWQLAIADGEPLPLRQEDLTIRGHSFEARIYAEDPDSDFLPTAGEIECLRQPKQSAHVRVDTGVLQGDEVGVYYDPMIAKLIVWHQDRDSALQMLRQALKRYQITGLTTNVHFLQRIAAHPAFANAELSTGFIENNRASLFSAGSLPLEMLLPSASVFLVLQQKASCTRRSDETSPWHALDNWRLSAPPTRRFEIEVGENSYQVSVQQRAEDEFVVQFQDDAIKVHGELDGDELTTTINGRTQVATVLPDGEFYRYFSPLGNLKFAEQSPDYGQDLAELSDGFASDFKAPMNGTVVEIQVAAGDRVSAGDVVVIMEAMKMEHSVCAPADGFVTEVFCAKGDLISGGSELLGFERDLAEA